MKTLFSEISSVVDDLRGWVEAPSPPCSLVLGAASNGDLPAIQSSVLQLLNRIRGSRDFRYKSLDYGDIRFIAGQPELRAMIAECSGIGSKASSRSDIEQVIRGLASMGGLILGGQAALDATHRMPNVCRLMLCSCKTCRESGLHGKVDQEKCEPGQLPAQVILRYLDWMAGHPDEQLSEVSMATEAGQI